LIEIIYKYYKQYLYTNMADKEKSVKAKPKLKVTRKKTVAVAVAAEPVPIPIVMREPIVQRYEDDYNKISPVYNPEVGVKTPSASIMPYPNVSPDYDWSGKPASYSPHSPEGPPPPPSGPRTPSYSPHSPEGPPPPNGPRTPEGPPPPKGLRL
jgi:hypothetical protein